MILKMNNSQIYRLTNNITYVDNEAIVNIADKIFIFEKFELELLKKFDGSISLTDIIKELKTAFDNSFNEEEFLVFFKEMMEKGVLSQIE